MLPIASAGNRPPDSTEACSMAETNSRTDRTPRAPAESRRQRQRVRLRTARRKHHILGPGGDLGGDGGACILDQPTRLPTFGMNSDG